MPENNDLNTKALQIAYELFQSDEAINEVDGKVKDGTPLSASGRAKMIGKIAAKLVNPILDANESSVKKVRRNAVRSGMRKLGWNGRQEPDDDIPGCSEPGGGSGDCRVGSN